MHTRILLILFFILTGSLVTTAANASDNGEEAKKERYQYVNTSNALGFSLFNLLSIQRIPDDSSAVAPAKAILSEEEQTFRESILSPFAF